MGGQLSCNTQEQNENGLIMKATGLFFFGLVDLSARTVLHQDAPACDVAAAPSLKGV